MSIHQPYSKLLINEEPLQVLPSLACKVGLHEAIVLQQVHYWLGPKRKSGKVLDSTRWIFNSYAEWQEQFPFFTEKVIGNAIRSLEKQGYLLSRQDLNEIGSDRRKWYTINYKAFGDDERPDWDDGNPSGDDGSPDWDDVNRSAENTTENTTEINVESDIEREYQQSVFDKWYDAYPRKVGKADARKAFAKVIKTVPLATLIEAVENQKQGEQWRDPKYIPHPATWLNREGWEDEVIPAKPTAPSRAQFNDPQKYSREQVMLDIANMKAGR